MDKKVNNILKSINDDDFIAFMNKLKVANNAMFCRIFLKEFMLV